MAVHKNGPLEQALAKLCILLLVIHSKGHKYCQTGGCLPANLQKFTDGIICRLKWLFSDTIFIYLNSHFCSLTLFNTPTYTIEMRCCFVCKSYFHTNKLVFTLKGSGSQMEVPPGASLMFCMVLYWAYAFYGKSLFPYWLVHGPLKFLFQWCWREPLHRFPWQWVVLI